MPNQIAVAHNNKVKNNYGCYNFLVYHSGLPVPLKYSANNYRHLHLLLAIEKNSGYILSIDKIIPIK